MIIVKKPKIRFKGFTETWEQRKLGELVGIYDGVHQTPDYQDSGIMFLSVENIATLKSEKYIAVEAFERDYKVYPEKGDILMTRIGDVGTTNVVETVEKVAFYVSLALLKPNRIDSYFLSNAMKTNVFQKGLRERTLVTAIPQKINKDEIGKIDIFITNNDEEQKKIGAYFSNLDHLITLHQRQCENLKKLKKFMLQKLFPQNGENVPEIRFSNFTDTWEQRKLGSICKITMGQSPNGSTYSETPCDYILVQGNADLKDGWVVPRIWTSQITKTAKSGDLIMSVRAPAGAIGKTAYDVVIGRGVASINGNEFIYQTLKKYEIEGYWRKIATGSTFKSINSEDINDTILFVPIDDSEQKQIGSLFSKLDNLITLHQSKCDKLIEVKKYMLQNMFI